MELSESLMVRRENVLAIIKRAEEKDIMVSMVKCEDNLGPETDTAEYLIPFSSGTRGGQTIWWQVTNVWNSFEEKGELCMFEDHIVTRRSDVFCFFKKNIDRLNVMDGSNVLYTVLLFLSRKGQKVEFTFPFSSVRERDDCWSRMKSVWNGGERPVPAIGVLPAAIVADSHCAYFNSQDLYN